MAESASNAAVIEPVPQPAPSGRRTSESIADDVMNFLAEEQPAPKPAKEPKPKKSVAEQPVQEPARGPREVTLPDSEEEEDEGDDGVGDAADGNADPEPDEQVDEADVHADEPIKGHSREHPFPAKELPKDRFVELTVDGEKTVVDMAELARGYIGFQTTQRRLTAASELSKRAEAEIQNAEQSRIRVRENLEALFDDDQQLFDFMLERNEGILLKVAQRMGERVKRFREDPNLFERERIQREERKVAQERARLEQERQAADQQREFQRIQQERAAEFNPGWAEGLKRAGFPELNERTHKELFEEVLLRCNQRWNNGQGKPVSRAEVAEFVVRACKLLELGPKGSKPRPAPARVPVAPRERPKNGRGSKDWDSMPQQRRVLDPDYLLERSGVRAQEFRR